MSPEMQAAVERGLAARLKQGLPPTIKDPVTLDKAAALFSGSRQGDKPTRK